MLDTYSKPGRAARTPKHAVQTTYKASKALYTDTDSDNDLSVEDQMPKPAGVCCCCCMLTATRALSMRHSNPVHDHLFRYVIHVCACAGLLANLVLHVHPSIACRNTIYALPARQACRSTARQQAGRSRQSTHKATCRHTTGTA
jgi:hypothetical protein